MKGERKRERDRRRDGIRGHRHTVLKRKTHREEVIERWREKAEKETKRLIKSFNHFG